MVLCHYAQRKPWIYKYYLGNHSYNSTDHIKMDKADYPHINAEEVNELHHRTIFICYFNLSKDLIIFPSENAMKDYCKTKDLPQGCEEYNLILQKQYNGLAMPLLEVKFNKTKRFGGKKFFTIDKFIPVPRESNRLFNKSIDRHTFCIAYRNSGKKHYKYTFKFEPDPQDSSKNFQTYLFNHRKAHLGDIPKIGNDEGNFRWILTNKSPRHKYTYSLFLLDPGQPSLTDNMDTLKMELDPKNELIQNRPWMGKALHSPNKIATLIHLADNHGTFSIHPTACLKVHRSKYLKGLESDSIHSLNIDELIFICTSIVSKFSSEKNTTMNETLQKLFNPYYFLTQVI